jgi:hypothetical protein
MPVWEDHLLPLMTCKDAARLGSTCKALRVVVREHFKNLDAIEVQELQAALTTFPRAHKLWLQDSFDESTEEEWGGARRRYGGAAGVASRRGPGKAPQGDPG